MASSRHIVRQRDFSGGEVVEHAMRRDDEPIVRSSCRTLRNARILSSGAVEQRPGRTALFSNEGRNDEIRMTDDYSIFLCFGHDGSLTIRSEHGAPLARAFGYDWGSNGGIEAVVARVDNDLVITFPGQAPKIARWDGGTEWTFVDWEASETAGGQKRVPFLRIAPKSITLLPSARTGTINLTFSDDYLVAGMVGTRIRFINRQIEIATVTSATAGTGTVKEPLPGSQVLNLSTNGLTSIFALGEIVEGSATGSKGLITSLATGSMTVQLLTTGTSSLVLGGGSDTGEGGNQGSAGFSTADTVVGPGGAFVPTSVGAIGSPVAVTFWDEEVFNDYRGWPQSCFADQSRLGFCDFPAVPEGIAWSGVLTPDDFYPGADPSEAIFETVPRKVRVYNVTDGNDEFVFTDLGVYYIPISEANPLRPGSVAFRRIPGAPASSVRPVSTAQGVVYANNAGNRVLAIVGTGQTAQPYLIRPSSDLQSHLFSGITCLAVEEGGGSPPDELVYAVNTDGTVVVGRYQPGKDWPGWVLWESDYPVRWASAAGNAAVFSVDYPDSWLAERVNADAYLDASVDYDAIPGGLAGLLPDTFGTEVGGNMTGGGGLAAARDGDTDQVATECASAVISAGFIFVRFGQPLAIHRVEMWPSSDTGFATAATTNLGIRGFNGTTDPTATTDGTLLAQTGTIPDTDEMVALTSGDQSTAYDGSIITNVPGVAGTVYFAEIRIYVRTAVTHILIPYDQDEEVGGNMTAGGGVASARDGVTDQALAASAGIASSAGFVFVRFGVPMKIARADVWGSNDQFFSTQASVTIQLRGFNGATDPTTTSDGTLLATTGSVTDDTVMRSLTSTDMDSTWDGILIAITAAAATQYLAEIQIYTPNPTHGSGLLWFLPETTVDIMDGRRVVGTGTIDASGTITADTAPTDEQIGLGFDVTIEPFVPHIGPGQDANQTMHKRQIAGGAVAVQNSTGLKVQSYNQNTEAWQTEYTRSAYEENASIAEMAAEPIAREEVVTFTVKGSEYDPRIRIFKDYPGPLRVLEIGVKVDA